MTVILYTGTECAKCHVLDRLFKQKQIEYKIETNELVLHSLGIKSVPMVKVDDNELMDFADAFRWAVCFKK